MRMAEVFQAGRAAAVAQIYCMVKLGVPEREGQAGRRGGGGQDQQFSKLFICIWFEV